MKKYIFYTSEGFTLNSDGFETENCQILDWQEGKDEKEAIDNFKRENSSILFHEICCQELASERVYYF